jgi:RHS repeat-associated protein
VFSPESLTVNVTNLFGNVRTYRYDGQNRLLRSDVVLTASGLGNGTQMGATPDGVIAATPTADPAQGGGDGLLSVRLEWDGDSRLIRSTDDNGNRTQSVYDNLDRRVSETQGISVAPGLADRDDPDTTTLYQYDRDHNVRSITDENGDTVQFAYDAANRLIGRDIHADAGVGGLTLHSYEYDGLSRLTRAFSDMGTSVVWTANVRFSYDSLGRVIEENQDLGPGERSVSSVWRAENLRAALMYPTFPDRTFRYEYDGLDRVARVLDPSAGQSIAQYRYLGKSRVADRQNPFTGIRLTYLDAGTLDVGYDGARRNVLLRHLRSDDELVLGFGSTYDREDNRLSESKLHHATGGETWAYDSAYRLRSFARPGGTAPEHSSFTLDGPGNWSSVGAETRQHSSSNETIVRDAGTTTTLEYDANGNLIDDGTLLYAWDPLNLLRRVTRKSDSTVLATYDYDALNRRIHRAQPGAATEDAEVFYRLDGARQIEERTTGEMLRARYIHGAGHDELLLIERDLDAGGGCCQGIARFYYHENALGSVYGLTNPAGLLKEAYQYDAYGGHRVFTPGANAAVDFGGDDVVVPGSSCVAFFACAVSNPFRFTGRRFDVGDLYDFRTRNLSPHLGRFLSRDTIGVWGDPGNFGNGYAYAGNNPGTAVDPFGRAPGDPFNGIDVGLIDKSTGNPSLIDKSTGNPSPLGEKGPPRAPGDPYNGLDLSVVAEGSGALSLTDEGIGNPTFGEKGPPRAPGDPYNGLDVSLIARSRGALSLIDKSTGNPTLGEKGPPRAPGDPYNGLDLSLVAGSSGALSLIDKSTGNPTPLGEKGPPRAPGDPFNGLDVSLIDKATGNPGLIDKSVGNPEPREEPGPPGAPGDPFNGLDGGLIDKSTGNPRVTQGSPGGSKVGSVMKAFNEMRSGVVRNMK